MPWFLWKEFLKKHTGTIMHWIGLSRKQGESWKWTNDNTFNDWWVSNIVGKIYWLYKKLNHLELWHVPFDTETYPRKAHLPSAMLNGSEIFHVIFICFPFCFFRVWLVLIPPIANSNSTVLQIPGLSTWITCTFSNYLNLYKIFLL